MKQFNLAPKRATYQLLKYFFWCMPSSLRQELEGLRHRFVRWFKCHPNKEKQRSAVASSDLSWKIFSTNILSKRESYKGVFLQELIIDWDVPLFQRPQHIATALGRLGYLVIYRTSNWTVDNVDGFREVCKNVWVTNRYEVASLEGVVCSFYSTAYALSPLALSKYRKGKVIVYEYIDHIDNKISGDDENIKILLSLKECAFSGGADYIITSARKLYDEAVEAVGRKKVVLIQNGVDTSHYRDPVHDFTSIPSSLKNFKNNYKNIVGYFGAIAPWLWYDLIKEVVASRNDLGFVFIGPDYYGGVQKLPDFENILYLGSVDYKVLPSYAKHFDVCWIPFEIGEIARTTSPLKLFEYFALEKPVVVTSEMYECVIYCEVFHGDTIESFISAIDKAILIKDDDQFKKRLAMLADENNWNERALEYEKIFAMNHCSLNI